MLIIHTITLLSIASITLLPRSVLSNCCYSFTCQPLQSSSPYFNGGGPPSFQISVTASSQNAINTPGSIYRAQIKFPSGYVLATIPSNCAAISINAVSCSSLGISQLLADFKGVIITTDIGHNISPQVQSVVVNGEQCGFQNACPVLAPTTTTTTLSWNSTKTTTAATIATSITTSATPSATSSATITTMTSSCSPSTSSTPFESGDTSATDENSYKSNNVGLIVGLTLGVAVLVLLFSLCILRRNKKGHLELFLKISCNGSGISLCRSSGPAGTGLREENDASLEGRNGYGAAKSTESEAPLENTPKIMSAQTTQAMARGLMDGRVAKKSEARPKRVNDSNIRSQGMTTTRSSPYKSPRQGRSNEGNRLENENDKVERGDGLGDPNDTATPAAAIEHQPLHRGSAANRSGLAKLKNFSCVASTTSKKAILQQAVSAASSRIIRTYSSRPLSSSDKYQDLSHRPGAPTFPQTGVIIFRKNPIIPPKSVHRASSRSHPNPSGNVITTIKPEHQKQQILQLQIENDSAYIPQGRSDGDSQPMLHNYRQLVNSGYELQGSGIRTSGTDVFTNPGPPPQPPQPAIAPSTQPAQSSRREYARPIHIRSQSRVLGIQRTLGSENDTQDLYGYM